MFQAILATLFLSVKAQTTQNSLLWKITGNGLTAPSYLYGTMHVKDRRVFNLSDSVYAAMKNTSGFAMEILPDSMMSAIIVPEEKLRKVKDTTKVENLLSKEELDQLDKKLIRHLGVGYKSVDLHRRQYLTRLMSYDVEHDDDMPTFLDAYLMGISRRTGKKIHGLEVMSEYTNIDLERPLNRQDLLLLINTEMNRKKGFGEYLTQLYVQEKLPEMCSLINTDSAFKKTLLLDRNINMANRMDSLMQRESMFTAVGAAHLPDAGGVIELLRQKGYRVEPVIATTRTPISEFPFDMKEINWHRYQSEVYNFELDLPGPPVKMNQTEASLQMYMDLGTGICYMIGEGTNYQGTPKEKMDAMIERFQASMYRVTLKSRKEIMQEGYPGMDIVAVQGKQEVMRMRVFVRENTVMFIMAFTDWKAKLFNPETDHVLSSLHFTELTPPSWLKTNFEKQGISVSMPTKPAQQFKKGSIASGENYDAFAASAPDNSSGIAYTISQLTLKPGYVFDNDTLLYHNYKEQMESSSAEIISDTKDTISGIPANRLYVKMENGFFQAALIKYANRFLVMIASAGDSIHNNADVEGFFSSLQLTAGEQTTYSTVNSGEFTTWAPRNFSYLTNRYELVPDLKTMKDLNNDELSDYEIEKTKFEAADRFNTTWTQLTWDSLSGVSYSVCLTEGGKYYWAPNDSTLFRDFLKVILKDNDSTTAFVQSTINGSPAVDVTVVRPFTSGHQRIKLIASGNNIYYMYAYLPEKGQISSNSDKVFSEFRLTSPFKSTFTQSKADSLFKDLRSTDTLTFTLASKAIEESGLNSKDLKALYQALFYDYPEAENEYYTSNSRLSNKFRELADSTLIPLLKEEYPKIPENQRKRQQEVLKALTGLKTKAAFDLYGEFMKQPQYGDDFPYSTISDLGDSLPLTKTLYPGILNKLQDTVMAMGICNITCKLLDSGYVSMEDLKPYKTDLQNILKGSADRENSSYHDLMYDAELIRLLRFTDDESINLLRAQLNKKLTDRSIQSAIMLTKLGKGNADSKSQLEKVASDIARRNWLYGQMKIEQITDSFPTKYASGKSLAEAELYEYLNYEEEYDHFKLAFLEERDYVKNDTAYSCYLFVADFGSKTDKRLAVAGPYIKGTHNLAKGLDFNGSYYEESFDKKKIEEQFNAYIKALDPDNSTITEEITELPPPPPPAPPVIKN